jgi:hypothetical protein
MSHLPQSSPEEQLLQLLRNKREESPGEEYFEGVLPRIHLRLRSEMMRKSATMLVGERIGVFFDNLFGGHRVAAGLAAYAVAILQWRAEPQANSPVFQPVSLSPSSQTRQAQEKPLPPAKITPIPAPPAGPR